MRTTGNSTYDNKIDIHLETRFPLTTGKYTGITHALVLMCHFNFCLFEPTYLLSCTGGLLLKLVGSNPTKSKEKLFQNKETAFLLSKNISQAHNQTYKIIITWNLKVNENRLEYCALTKCYKFNKKEDSV